MDTSRTPALEVRHLRTHFSTPYGTARSVDDVSFTLAPGHVLGIVGESGSGKTVLSRTIMRLLPKKGVVSSGEVSLSGRELLHLRERDMREVWGHQLSMVFQDPMTALNPVMRVGDQLAESMRRRVSSRAEANERVVRALASVGIPDPVARSRQYPHELSGGMRQRVVIAMALAGDPEVLIADEPTTALDVTVQAQIMALLREQQRRRQMSMILITHDLGIASQFVDDLLVMYAGQVVERGPVTEVLRAPRSPYTEALSRSIPRIENPPHTRLDVIPGRPPAMTELPSGCRFAPRCRYAQERCLEEAPELSAEDERGRSHRCHFPVGSEENRIARERNLTRGATAAEAAAGAVLAAGGAS